MLFSLAFLLGTSSSWLKHCESTVYTHTHNHTHANTHTHRIDGGFTYHWRVTKVCNDYGLLSTEILEKDKEKNI